MKAFSIDRYGKNEIGHIVELPDPRIGEDDVLVQVQAASVNVLDARIRSGEFKLILPYRLPLILGNDVAGIVNRVGSRVSQFKPGDEVYARCDPDRIGTFAEFIAVKAQSLARKPANLSMEDAASIPLVALTAWQVLVDTAKIQRGQKVLIHAGSGGVGTVAIQLAKHLGAFVATTTSTRNVEWVKALGADIVIDYTAQDFSAELRDYDVVLHSLGNEELKKSIPVLKRGGRLISISGPPTPELAAELGLSWPLKQALRLLSYGIRKRSRQHGVNYAFIFMRPEGKQLGQITELIESGVIRPVIDRVFTLEATADALAYVDQGRAKGKVIIKVK